MDAGMTRAVPARKKYRGTGTGTPNPAGIYFCAIYQGDESLLVPRVDALSVYTIARSF
ncbi:protein of unknown function [Paraburkholderia dioscoreae]|uniref:Uncharacterized protein n=1 Tax=Paraburkholderia dioscoreae TaxID=2604047 RepID=A0A5Q4Z794_9BURK|nr:protein of unknown function [Paraburkholderia dioscoreae]